MGTRRQALITSYGTWHKKLGYASILNFVILILLRIFLLIHTLFVIHALKQNFLDCLSMLAPLKRTNVLILCIVIYTESIKQPHSDMKTIFLLSLMTIAA